ncbi:MAG: site-specific integrase, partial [Deltaproteobacteria bacterium]|nr:site-specific integrase [Deltaproteobacteria bacterium]
VGGVTGLGLNVSETGAASWVLRVTIAGQRRDIGLGGYPDVTLAAAREAARTVREKIKQGIDPVAEALAARRAMAAEQAKLMTFAFAAEKYIQAHEAGWANPKHKQQWRNTLEQYAAPLLGELDVRTIETAHIVKVLEPIWSTKTETAKRLQGRIERVLDWCIVREFRSGPNPAQWRGRLDAILPRPGKVSKKENFPALPYSQIHDFVTELRGCAGTAAQALEFLILTAARSGEVRGLDWSEIDTERALWTIPATRMKMKRDHCQPLSRAALAILGQIPEHERQGIVFKGMRGAPVSDATLTAVIRRMNAKRERTGLPAWKDPQQDREITVHGFRSSFRTWGAETGTYPREVVEKALSHDVAGKVEAAYQRSEYIDARRRLLEDWAEFVESGEVQKVVALATVSQRGA